MSTYNLITDYEFRYKIVGGSFTSWVVLSGSNAVDNGNGTITINGINYNIAIGDFQVRAKAKDGNPASTALTNSTAFVSGGDVPITPSAPTNAIEDLDEFTIDFTLSTGYTLSQHEFRYKITGGSFTSWTTCTTNTIQLPNADIAIGDVEIRVKAIGIDNPSSALLNSIAFIGELLPSIISTTNNQSVEIGNDISLLVVASGSTPLSYQWYKSGIELEGETADSLLIEDAVIENAGNYKVRVTNDFGTVLSNNITVVVSTQVITALSGIPDLAFDFNFADATDTGGKITSITDAVGGIVSSQSEENHKPSYMPNGGLLNQPYGKFEIDNSNRYQTLSGPVLLEDSEAGTIFIIRKLISPYYVPISVTYFQTGTNSGIGFIDNLDANRKGGIMPQQAGIPSRAKSIISGRWEMEIFLADRAGSGTHKVFNILGDIDNYGATTGLQFVLPTGTHNISAAIHSAAYGNNIAIQRVFGYSRALTDLEIRTVSEYISQNFELELPNKWIAEGDSISAFSNDAYPNLLSEDLIADGEILYLRNKATSGWTSGDIITGRLSATVAAFDPRVKNVFTIMIGHNDLAGLVGVEGLWDNIQTICSSVRNAGFTVVLSTILMSSLELQGQNYMDDLLDINNRIRTSGTSVADIIWDAYNIPEMMDPTDTDYYYDQIHPTVLGQQVLSDDLKPIILSILNS